MSKIVIFGAGGTGRKLADSVADTETVLCFLDSDKNKWGSTVAGVPVRAPRDIQKMDYDYVLIGATSGMDEMEAQLLQLNVPLSRIRKRDTMLVNVRARELFLERFAQMAHEQGLKGNVAEAGVFRGEFAKHINRVFPDRLCYLFDTFTGFNSDDFKYEGEVTDAEENHFSGTSVELVMRKMPHPQMVCIKQGWFPESAAGINDRFIFVNLDMDLYKPTFEGLKFFWEKMEWGGGHLIT